MLTVEPFRPIPNGTVSILASSSNGTAALNTSIPTAISVAVFNQGPATVYVEFGGAASVAASATSSMPIPSGTLRVLSVDQASFVAAITTSTGTGLVFFTRGYGI